MLILMIVLSLYFKINVLKIEKEARITLAIRSLIGVTGIPVFFLVFQYMMMSRTGIIINYSQWLLVVAVAYFILKEPLTVLNILSSIGAYIGVAIIALGRKELEGSFDDKSIQFQILLAT